MTIPVGPNSLFEDYQRMLQYMYWYAELLYIANKRTVVEGWTQIWKPSSTEDMKIWDVQE